MALTTLALRPQNQIRQTGFGGERHHLLKEGDSSELWKEGDEGQPGTHFIKATQSNLCVKLFGEEGGCCSDTK